MIPGIFGEFIKDVPFQEVYDQPDTAYARQFADKFANHADDSDKHDGMYSLDALGEE